MPISIRKATTNDLEDIYEIELECFAADAFSKGLLEYFLSSPNFVTLIAVSEGQPAGFITGSLERSRRELAGRIHTLDVKRDHRRKGVGSGLLTCLEHALAVKGVEVCYLEARVDNVAAKRLYLRRGYEPFETLTNYYGLGHDGLRLKKDLRLRK